nr:putative methyltransferase [Oceanusvirus sp.]
MKLVLLNDCCDPDDMEKLGIPVVRAKTPSIIRPGDFVVMPLDKVDRALATKHKARACFSCDEDVVKKIRNILANDVLVVGKATADPVPPAVEKLFGKICYVKCNARNHKGDKHICTNNVAWYTGHKFLQNHNENCKVFFPNKWERGRQVISEKPPKNMTNTFDSDVEYTRMPELKKAAPGWLTTGMATAFHFVFEKGVPADAHIYMYRFSHWKNGAVVTPPKGMKNAFGRPPGRHNVEIERRAAQILQDTGRVYSYEPDADASFALVVPPPVQTPHVQQEHEEEDNLDDRLSSVRSSLKIREDIARLIPEGGVAVELGVAAGQFSKKLLQRSNASRIYSIDAWAGENGHNHKELKVARAALKPFGDRSEIIRAYFKDALDKFEDEAFDLVYIDGYASSGQEDGKTLEDWWCKLKPGGVFSGDDYCRKSWPRVCAAVDEFALSVNCSVNVIPNMLNDRPVNDRNTKFNKYPTWWIVKPPDAPRKEEKAPPKPVPVPPPTFPVAPAPAAPAAAPAAAAAAPAAAAAAAAAISRPPRSYISLWSTQSYVDAKMAFCSMLDARLFSGKGRKPATMIDIGCGLAHEALYFQKKYGTRVWLVEGDSDRNSLDQKRTSKYGSSGTFVHFAPKADLIKHYDSCGLQYTLLEPGDETRDLPRFDFVLSMGACGMFFPVNEYSRILRKHTRPDSTVVLELNDFRKMELKKQGVDVLSVLEQTPKSRVCVIRMK